MDIETITNDIIEHGLKTGNFNDPVLTKRLIDFFEADDKNDMNVHRKKIDSFRPRSLTRILKKKDSRPKKAHSSFSSDDDSKKTSSSSSSSEDDYIAWPQRIGMTPQDQYNAPTIISSIPIKPYEDDYWRPDMDGKDTTIVDVTDEFDDEGGDDLIEFIERLRISTREKETSRIRDDELAEISKYLDTVPREIASTEAWLSMFLFSNTSDYVSREDLISLCSQHFQ